MNNETMLSGKIPVLDTLRAFAALSVCLYHFICTTTGYIETQWVLTVFSFGKYGVQMFFVISGFVIPWAMYKAGYKFSNFFTFLLKRLARLEPPYIVSLILAIVVLLARNYFIASDGSLEPVSITRVLLHFGYLIPFFNNFHWINQVYWTLAIEFQYYLFIAFIFVPLVSGGIYARLCVYLVLLASGFNSSTAFLPHWLPVFLLGVLAFLFLSNNITKVEFNIVTALTLIIGVFIYEIGELVYMIIPVVAILYFGNKEWSAGNFFGKMSYSIYLIHPVIGATLINVLSHKIQNPSGKVFVILLGVLVTIMGAWIMYLIIEKPSKKLSSAITYKKLAETEVSQGNK